MDMQVETEIAATPIVETTSDMESTKATKSGPKTAEQDGDTTASPRKPKVLNDAIRGVELIETRTTDATFVAIAQIHALRRAALATPALLDQLAEMSKIKKRKNTPDSLYLTKAVLACASVKRPKQTAHDWSRVLNALQLVQVGSDTKAVIDWLKKPENVDGSGELTGFKKAYAIDAMAAAEREKAGEASSKTDRAGKRAAKQQRDWDEYLSSLNAPIGPIKTKEPFEEEADGYVLHLTRIANGKATVLDVVMMDEAAVQRCVLRNRQTDQD